VCKNKEWQKEAMNSNRSSSATAALTRESRRLPPKWHKEIFPCRDPGFEAGCLPNQTSIFTTKAHFICSFFFAGDEDTKCPHQKVEGVVKIFDFGFGERKGVL
jgi:hypothetical protein